MEEASDPLELELQMIVMLMGLLGIQLKFCPRTLCSLNPHEASLQALKNHLSGVVLQICNLRTWEAKAGGS